MTIRSLSQAVAEEVAYLDAAQKGDGGPHTGFRDLDDLLGGFWPGQLTILAGRTGMGKTALALDVAANLALDQARGVGVFSMQLCERELAKRWLVGRARLPLDAIRRGRLESHQLLDVLAVQQTTAGVSILLETNPEPGVCELVERARAIRSHLEESDKPLGMLIIDSLQSIRPAAQHRHHGGYIAWALKQLAEELHVPVLVTSDLSPAIDDRADKRPLLRDLEDVGRPEQHADAVLLLYRDDHYHPDSAHFGEAEVTVVRTGHGSVGTATLFFLERHGRFATHVRG